jgi:hypothetical protein
MVCGDLVFVNNRIFIAYDKTLVIGANIVRVVITPIKQLILSGEPIEVYRLKMDTGYSKKKKMSDFLVTLAQKQNLTLKEKINFHKVIHKAYSEIFKTELLDHTSIPVTIANLKDSDSLERININV